jgi:hypothetical protein
VHRFGVMAFRVKRKSSFTLTRGLGLVCAYHLDTSSVWDLDGTTKAIASELDIELGVCHSRNTNEI